MKNIKFAVLTLSLFSSAAFAQQPAKTKVPSDYRIEVPQELRKSGRKLRVVNKATGQQKVIDLADQEFIGSEEVRDLLDPKTQVFKPEFSILDSEQRRSPPQALRSTTGSPLTRSLVFDQPIWRELGYSPRAPRVKNGPIVFKLDSKAGRALNPNETTVTGLPAPTADEAARRRGLQEGGDIRKLFDIGWRAIAAKRYDLGVIAFERLIKKGDLLDAEQVAQAHLGHGLSSFHQNGCAKLEEDFRIAERNPSNKEDISYYRGMCFVEAKQFPAAEKQFTELAKMQSAKYGESSRFFLGVVAENQERYDDAESSYLDTIDFAQDQRLVGLAKTRLENVRQLRAQKDFESKWFMVMATLGGGYDTNVVGLPQSVSPADFALTNEASASWLGLLYTEVRPPWTRSADWKLKYTFLTLNYTRGEIADSNDIKSHEIGTSVGFQPTKEDHLGMGLSYNSVYKGRWGHSGEYLATPAFEVNWQQVQGAVENPTSDFDLSGKVSLARPKMASSAELDSYATSYLVAFRQNYHLKGGETMGPGLDLEVRPARGSDVSYYAGTLLGKWDFPLGEESLQMFINQELALQYSNYYQSSASRKDALLRYTGSISKLWSSSFESRLQFIGTATYSSVPTKYQYHKAQINLLLTAFY
ncbi:MAG: hypothetical protein JST16_06155 [Bdellovibrionales bacterium]|nr:hypothetical protein [Bdellovibrionales bacterium]